MTTTTAQEQALDLDQFREKAREWLAANAPKRGTPEAEELTRTGDMGSDAERHYIEVSKDFQARLHDGGFAGITVPVEYGGQGLTRRHQSAFNQEASAYVTGGGPFYIGLGMCLPTILTHGTEEQKQRFVRPMIRGEEIWSQLFSEPGAGSDVAGLQSKAERADDEWVINGQKVWTTGAHYSDFGCVIVRTDPDVPKHQGLTMFIVDFRAPGVTTRPLRQITGEAHFNEVFFDDVRAPDTYRLDDIGSGWKVAMTMLMNERLAIGGAGGGGGSRRGNAEGVLVRMARETNDANAKDGAIALYVQQRVLGFLRERMTMEAKKGIPGPEFSMLKLLGARLAAAQSEFATNVLGAQATAWTGESSTGERWAMQLLGSRSGKIAGGTDEVMLNILGERVLGLPQDPRVDKDIPFREIKVGR